MLCSKSNTLLNVRFEPENPKKLKEGKNQEKQSIFLSIFLYGEKILGDDSASIFIKIVPFFSKYEYIMGFENVDLVFVFVVVLFHSLYVLNYGSTFHIFFRNRICQHAWDAEVSNTKYPTCTH
jgi:hypothetical protein